MRSVAAAFESALAEGSVRFTELYILEMADGAIGRYTSHSKDITWDATGNTYTACPIKRGAIDFTTNFQSGGVSIEIANVSGAIISDVNNNKLERAMLTIKRIPWDASYASNMEFQIGPMFTNVEFDRSTLKLKCIPVTNLLGIKVPRHKFQPACNNRVFDTTCGLDRSDGYGYSGTATDGSQSTVIDSVRGAVYKVAFDAGNSSFPVERGDTITGGDNSYTAVVAQIVYLTASTGYLWYVELSNSNNFNDNEILSNGGDTVTVNGSPAEHIAFYEQGEIAMTSGDNSGHSRQIVLNNDNTVTVAYPFPADVQSGDTYLIYPGCDGKAATCRDRFGNKLNFRGFLYGPRVEETIF